MTQTQPNHRPTVRPRTDYDPTRHQRAKDKTSRIPIKVERTTNPLKKPSWIRVKAAAPNSKFRDIKRILRETNLFTVCEERSEEHTSELQSRGHLVCRLLLEKKNTHMTSAPGVVGCTAFAYGRTFVAGVCTVTC